MQTTGFYSTYYSYLLTWQSAENSVSTFIAMVQDSKVGLNPHQIEVALFVWCSPFSRGLINKTKN